MKTSLTVSTQNILGHSKINVTLDVYTHIKKTNIDEATEKLNKFLKQLIFILNFILKNTKYFTY